jgi:hypothetical protein
MSVMVQTEQVKPATAPPPTGAGLNEAHRRLAQACREVVANTLPPLLNGLFERLDDTLFAQSEKGGVVPLEDARLLRLLHTPIQQRLLGAVLRGYDALWGDGPEAGAQTRETFSEDSLSLVNERDLEESLAITKMVTKGENRYYRDLFAIARRFEHLAGLPEGGLDEKTLPIAPATVCELFRDNAPELPGDLNTRLLIFKTFENEVLDYLGGMYDEINALLVAQGILPKLPHRVHSHPVSPSVRRARGEEVPDDEGRSAEDEAAHAEGAKVLEGLRELVRMRREAVGEADGESHLPAVDSAGLMQALSQLQRTAPAAEQPQSDQVKAELLRQFQIGRGEGANSAIGRSEEDIIDVISMLFDFILEDRGLADAMKALIGRLQIPLLKVAILDRRFFGKKTHPARLLLNALAQAAVGWTDDGDRSPGSLYGRMEAVVKRVLTEFTEDVTLFGTLHDEFTNWYEQEHKKAAVSETRATQASEGKERLALARRQVRQELDRRLAAHGKVPKVVQALLDEAWSDVLRITWLRTGSQGEAWEQALQVVDRLLWSVQPKHDNQQRKEMLTAIPKLLKELREGLLGIAYDQHKMTRLFKELRNAHIACLRNEDMGEMVEPPAAPPAEPGATPPAARIPMDHAPAKPPQDTRNPGPDGDPAQDHADDPLLQQVARMEVGTWVEFRLPGQEPRRHKLAWRSRVTDQMVFVDRRGLKAGEMRSGELAEAVRNGEAVILKGAEKTLMERALDAMKGALQRTKEEAAAVHQGESQ